LRKLKARTRLAALVLRFVEQIEHLIAHGFVVGASPIDKSHTFTGLALERSIQDGARPLGLRGRRPRGLGPRCHDIFSIECIGGLSKN
jgi:hypothetical protein